MATISSFQSCSPEIQYSVLSFFFDGVPDPNYVVDTDSLTLVDSNQFASISEAKWGKHPPYADKACEKCHTQDKRLVLPQPDLCYQCHQDFELKYTNIHGPAAAGGCTQCHHPHMTKTRKLLKRVGQDLCFHCHEAKAVLRNVKHANIGNTNCTQCHSPHGGNNQANLKPGSCYECHIDFNSLYPRLHGPVIGGNCNACHGSHELASDNHLLRPGTNLCLHCHDSQLIYQNENHLGQENENCTTCHNPHGGSDRFVLHKNQVQNIDSLLFKLNVGPSLLKIDTALELHILSQDGSVVANIAKDEEGNYAATELKPDSSYIFKFHECDTSLLKEELKVQFSGGTMKLKQSAANLFLYEFIEMEITQLYMLSEFGDTLNAAMRNEEGQFVFTELPPVPNIIFKAVGDESSFDKEMEITIAGEQVQLAQSDDDPFDYDFLAIKETKLYLLSTAGDTLSIKNLSKEGLFEFSELPADSNYTFRLEGDSSSLNEEIKISVGGEPFKLKQSDRNPFVYDYLQIKLTTLYMLSTSGDTLSIAQKNEEGRFAFTELPTDTNYIFKMEGEATSLDGSMQIMVGGEPKNIVQSDDDPFVYDYLEIKVTKLYMLSMEGDTLSTASSDENGQFHFVEIPQDSNYTFKFEGDVTSLQEEIMIDLAGESMTLTQNEKDPFVYDYLQIKLTTLYMLSTSGDTLSIAQKNEEGRFAFTELPTDTNYIFKMEGEATSLDGSMQIMVGGEPKNIVQSDDDPFVYDYLEIKVTKLYMLSVEGDTLSTASSDENGQFHFVEVPQDSNYTFKFEGDVTSLQEEIMIDLAGESMTLTQNEKDPFVYDYLQIKLTTLYMLSISGDTLSIAQKNEEGRFAFTELPTDTNYIFKMEGEATSLDGSMQIMVGGEPKNIVQSDDDPFVYDYLEIKVTKLYMLSTEGDTLSTASSDENGQFHFVGIPQGSNYTFKFEGDVTSLQEEIMIDLAGESMTLTQNEKDPFVYDYLQIKLTTLYMLSTSGDTLSIAQKNEEGRFAFTELPTDTNYIFKMEGEATSLDGSMQIMVGGEPKNIVQSDDDPFVYDYLEIKVTKLYMLSVEGDTLSTASSDENGQFHFVEMPQDPNYTFKFEGDATSMVDEIMITMDGKSMTLKQNNDDPFVYHYLDVKETKLYLLNTDGDTLEIAAMDNNGSFEFKTPLSDSTNKFRLAPEDAHNIDLVKISHLTKDTDRISLTAVKDAQGYFNYRFLASKEAKMYLLDGSRDTVEIATINDAGYFVFTTLPIDTSFVFQLEADIETETDTLKIIYTNDLGQQVILIANEQQKGYFNYDYLQRKEAKLHLLNSAGDTVKMATLDKAGSFVFRSLPQSSVFEFQLESDKADLTDQVAILYMDDDGEEVSVLARRQENGMFRFKKLYTKPAKIHLLNTEGVIVSTTVKGEEQLFTFQSLPYDTGYAFELRGMDLTDIKELHIIVDGEIKRIVRGSDGLFRLENIEDNVVKLYLIDENGKTSITAQINAKGYFVFPNLPVREDLLFILETKDAKLIDEIQILRTDENKRSEIITVSRGDDHLFRYVHVDYIETKLHLININGDTLKTAIMNKDGVFHFQEISPDKNYLFLLDSTSGQSSDELLILLTDKKGRETLIVASKKNFQRFMYEYIPQINMEPAASLEEIIVPVVLEEGHKEIIEIASDKLEFNFGSEVIKISSYKYLEDLSKMLIKEAGWNIRLSGHTDNVGGDLYNLGLSKKRAESVKRALVTRGVASERVTVKYFGESQPISNNDTEWGMQKNRRVEMLIVQTMIVKGSGTDSSNTSQEIIQSRNLVFKIQIRDSKGPIYLAPANFRELENVEEFIQNGRHLYVAGAAYNHGYAKDVLLNQMKRIGFNDAVVVVIMDGKLISVEEAEKLLKND